MKFITLSGKSRLAALSTTVYWFKLFWTIKRERSPTTLEDGVTLTISPSALFAMA
jgi:hypothetical protein